MGRAFQKVKPNFVMVKNNKPIL